MNKLITGILFRIITNNIDLHRKYVDAKISPKPGLIHKLRKKLTQIVDNFKKDEIFNNFNTSEMILTGAQKMRMRTTWVSFQDSSLALYRIRKYYAYFYNAKKNKINPNHFQKYYLAFLTEYRYALIFASLIEEAPDYIAVLNEQFPELNLHQNSYHYFKSHYLNLKFALRFMALQKLYNQIKDQIQVRIRKDIDRELRFLARLGKRYAMKLTIKNSIQIVSMKGLALSLPIQESLSRRISITKLRRINKFLITQAQIKEIQPQLKPGDLLFEKREWFLTNLGVPGYWTHSVLYIGLPEERDIYFGNDREVIDWVKEKGEPSGDFNKLLQKTYPDPYEISTNRQDDGYYPRVIESLKEGVIFRTLEISIFCDGVGALRPRLPKIEKANAIFNAFYFSGRPYDFNFDIRTDSRLVCSEMICKCYEPTEKFKGMKFPLTERLRRKNVSANNIVRQFAEQYNTSEQQFDFILFYDGYEKRKCAVQSTLEAFLKSWKRPKWHVFKQHVPKEKKPESRKQKAETINQKP